MGIGCLLTTREADARLRLFIYHTALFVYITPLQPARSYAVSQIFMFAILAQIRIAVSAETPHLPWQPPIRSSLRSFLQRWVIPSHSQEQQLEQFCQA